MAIMSFSKDTIIDYVPEYGNNRQSEKPCIVRMKFIPFGVARENQRLLASKIKGADNQEKIMAISQAIQRENFLKTIDGVDEYYVGEEKVTDIEQFYMTAPASLIAEILEAQQDSYKLSQGQRKN